MADYNIDFVIPWVDNNDPNWIEQKSRYSLDLPDNSVAANRFRDWDLMRYWFRGIEKYASWANRIFFVTWGHLPSWLNADNPKLVIVKHSDYIPEEILPVFNSNAIEMNYFRIKELSEHFVCFNDDTFVINNTSPEDFFVDGQPCESALLGVLSARDPDDVFPHILVNNNALINKYFSKKEVLKKNWRKFFSPIYGKDVVRNFALLPFVYFSDFRDLHLPASHLKSSFEELFRFEPEYMKAATSNRFRSWEDVNQWLLKDWNMCKGNFHPRSPKWGMKFELGDDDDAFEYVTRQKGKVVCLNDSSESIDFKTIREKLVESFETILPEKSGFEK